MTGKIRKFLPMAALLWLAALHGPSEAAAQKAGNPQKLNVIFILSDDHRYDFMGFMGKVPGLKTPNMDKMAREGAHCPNAFVTTSLCSPSRASILTGLFSHVHKVVDNDAPADSSLIYFPAYLRQGGYQTAFIGKWHMGHGDDEPRPGFDHWVSFKGQGQYYNPTLNVDGKQVVYSDSAYITDVLTDHALDWLRNRKKEKPFFLYLSHKAVHAEFLPAPRHRGRYANLPINYPPTMYPPETQPFNYNSVTAPTPTEAILAKARKTPYRYESVPNWVKAQRGSWHGVDFMYNGDIAFNDFYRRYLETLLGIDESIGQVLEYLQTNGLLDNTVVFYMGDNGFSFGEHGLIDKRHAYEESMKVPLLVYGPGIVNAAPVKDLIQNIDIAPTILDIAGVPIPPYLQGRSFFPLLQGKKIEDWRKMVFYEYYWERPFPQTPSMHAVRSDRYKFIRYQGIWDTNEFFDLEADPWEANNLINDPASQDKIKEMNQALFDWLEKTNGLAIPLKPTLYPRPGADWKYGNSY